jgi:hypothetical protein
MAYIQGGGCGVMWFIVVFVAIIFGLCVAATLQMFRRHNFFAVIMAINGHDQQQK